MPVEREETLVWDAVDLQFFYQFERLANFGDRIANLGGTTSVASSQEALNVNNFDEVADSTWFTNRIGRHPLPLSKIVKGPKTGSGPSLAKPWIVKSAKTTGLTPGLLIKDAHSNYYLVKFDTPGSSELASGVEMIGTLIFHALGFNVPENFIANVSIEQFQLAENATTKNDLGQKIPFANSRLQEILAPIERQPNGKIRVLASKFLEGRPVGPYPYRGVRIQDPNDRIPHEHRRELRVLLWAVLVLVARERLSIYMTTGSTMPAYLPPRLHLVPINRHGKMRPH
jgi:hypothetical protein